MADQLASKKIKLDLPGDLFESCILPDISESDILVLMDGCILPCTKEKLISSSKFFKCMLDEDSGFERRIETDSRGKPYKRVEVEDLKAEINFGGDEVVSVDFFDMELFCVYRNSEIFGISIKTYQK